MRATIPEERETVSPGRGTLQCPGLAAEVQVEMISGPIIMVGKPRNRGIYGAAVQGGAQSVAQYEDTGHMVQSTLSGKNWWGYGLEMLRSFWLVV